MLNSIQSRVIRQMVENMTPKGLRKARERMEERPVVLCDTDQVSIWIDTDHARLTDKQFIHLYYELENRMEWLVREALSEITS